MNPAIATRSTLAALVLALTTCSSDDKTATTNPNIPPVAYKQEIIGTLRSLFATNDTVSVSNASLSDPVIKSDDKGARYTACVRYTAHGALPGQIGNAERVAYFHAGRLNQLVEAEQGQCEKVAYKPFPELDKLCLGRGCKDEEKNGGFGFGGLFGH
jgi:hypothetical protein